MRRLAFPLLFLLVFLLGLAGGAWALRTQLAETAAERWFASRGVPADLTVSTVGLDGLTVERLQVAGGAARAARIRIAIDWASPLRPAIAAVTVENAMLSLDLTDRQAPLGPLQPLIGGGGEASPEGGFPSLFPIRVDDLEIAASTAVGPAILRLDGAVEQDEAGRLAADLTLQGDTPVAVFGGRLRAAGTPQSLARLDADLRIAAVGAADGLEGRMVADIEDVPAAPRGRLTLDIAAGPKAAELVASLAPVAVAWDALQLTLDLRGAFPPLPESGSPWLAWVAGGDWTAAATFTGSGLAWPDAFAGGQALVALDARNADGALSILPAETAEMTIAEPAAALLDRLALPEDLAARLDEGLSLRLLPLDGDTPLAVVRRGDAGLAVDPALRLSLTAGPASAAARLDGHLELAPDGQPRRIALSQLDLSLTDWTAAGHRLLSAGISGRLTGPPDALDGSFDLSAETVPAVPGASLERLTLSWPMRVRADLPARQGSAEGPLALEAGPFAMDGVSVARLRAALQGRLTARLDSPEAPLALEAPGTVAAEGVRFDSRRVERLRAELEENVFTWSAVAGLAHSLAARWAPLALSVAKNGESLLEAEIDPGLWRVAGGAADTGTGYDGRLEVSGATVAATDPALTLADLSVAGPLPLAPGGALELDGRLEHTATPRLLPPLALSGTLEPDDAGYAVALVGRGLDGQLEATLTGEIVPTAPTLAGRLAVAPVAFAPGGLQPADLTPVLADLEDVSGRLSGRAGFRLSAAGTEAEAAATMEDFGFSAFGAVTASGVDGTLDFASLSPLRAPPPQVFTAERLEAGVTFADLRADLAVVPGADGAPRLQVLAAEAAALGGRVRLREGLLDPGGARQEAKLVLEEIDLAELVAFAGIEGVEATGTVSGEIPVVVRDGEVTVAGGRLEDVETGVLRVTSDAVRRTLAGGGQSVEMLVEALENFLYEDLALTIEKPAEGRSTVTLKLLGANPEVLDGQPFDVNVNLTTDLERLIQDLLTVLQATQGEIEWISR